MRPALELPTVALVRLLALSRPEQSEQPRLLLVHLRPDSLLCERGSAQVTPSTCPVDSLVREVAELLKPPAKPLLELPVFPGK